MSSAAAVSPVPVESTPTFAELGVPAAITARLAARSILHPFPIQAATLVDALAGRDVSGKAPTGSGKTIAFGIPLVAGVERAKPRQPRGLVLVPTRELAEQVCVELRGLAGGKPSVSAIFGGVGFGHQTRALRKGVDIVVACPGRLADLINQREISLHDVSFVVIDEADRMADMGFLPEVKRLLDQVRDDRQTLLFSATLDGAVDELVRRYQHDPVRHEHDPVDEAPPNRHVFWNVDRGSRINTAAQVIKAEWPAIVFCRTKHGADRVAKQLGKAGVTSVAMHGDRSQSQRKRALADFTDGRAQALVATDVAARGIHVDDVASVIHFDPPADEKDYVHRSGRTGRAGASGVVVSFIADDQVGDVRKMQRRLGMEEGVGQIHFDDLTDDHLLVRPAANGDSSSPGKGANGNATSSRARNRGRGRSGAGDDRSNRSAGAGQARRDDGRGSYGSRSNGTNGSRSNGAGNGSGGAPRGSGEGRPRGARSASVTGTGERSPDWSPEGGETGRQKPRNGGWSRNGSTNGSGGGRPGGKPKKRTARAGAPRNGQGGAPARAGGGKPGSKGPKAGGRPSGGRPGGSSSNRSRRPAGRS